MATKKEQERMKEYFAEKLNGCGKTIEPCRKEIVEGITSNYIKVGNDGLVILIERQYPNGSLKKLHEAAGRHGWKNVAFVFYNDGKIFLRSAYEDNLFKMERGLSLKNYTEKELKGLVQLTPAEIYVNSIRKRVQYYNDNSVPFMDEELMSVKFEEVNPDYNHVMGEKRKNMKRHRRFYDVPLKRKFIIGDTIENTGKVELKDGYLIKREPLILTP